jgi:hypothetical protein
MEKKGFISKYWLKYTDKIGYQRYKFELSNAQTAQFIEFLASNSQSNTPARIKELADTNHNLNFNHSGNAGDIIYALPTIKKIAEKVKVPLNLYLRPNQPSRISADKTHPLGSVMLNEKSIEMLEPLISSQPYINQYGAFTNQRIDIDLDYFRVGLVPLDKGNIAHWCAYITGVNPDLWKRWLTVEPDLSFKNEVVIARSERYRNIFIDYKFLRNYERLKFIGVESEFKDIRKHIPNIEWVQVNDFLQMAQIIAGCKFFIGNQSFPFSIAEALKVPRILEVSLEVINVIPEGENGYDFLFQDHFKALVNELYST